MAIEQEQSLETKTLEALKLCYMPAYNLILPYVTNWETTYNNGYITFVEIQE